MLMKAQFSSRVACTRTQSVAAFKPLPARVQARRTVVYSTPESQVDADLENPESEAAKKKAAADRLRAAEKFMVVGQGSATCNGCGYEYKPEKGDPEFPIAKGINFEQLPDDYNCPICGSPKTNFRSQLKVVAGFAENQKYGLGTNSMTGSQKTLLIYGALAIFFILFIAGYALD
uniref:Rubredoxin-like domain-containing protein n=1 Tax=Chlamydomonas leiostraca TaxID=1034604 RepID=A0A7S0WTU8_9CHLO|mmetsp:Transcript_28179/g.71843  ORF Transcript_28179/g.71843 Transcript_28179/m.71843 type:complete len:175 (+) Transcript_28179:60-584(+)|eukprot:CAMPEP_0202857654 /NCGR_PEP_ID=MMETSP1391-20130828/511_1 /ASSEMBLY_ACC=CAM_ASM_000867 /TAXON_ID=1034604 /ORGANISM="Chlamydomonas leiostraca, Strain SAG 11-49" /LENGTH=174 /DNA_ID=CAMNT_0049536481 /DNA_START=44 /DNA_END=568 /DNA_ORIENTATION=-